MNLESALQEMFTYYVTTNGDPEGFISDLAIILGHDEDIALELHVALRQAIRRAAGGDHPRVTPAVALNVAENRSLDE